MIPVDTSIGIALLNGRPGAALQESQLVQFATCGPVAQKVLQGLRDEPASEDFRQAFLALPWLGDPLASEVFLAAADIYRFGRARGYTIRSSVDCLIAAIAIAHPVTVWHRDRDFDAIARYTELRCLRRLPVG